MSLIDHKITAFTSPISAEADQPQRSSAEMKTKFDSNSNELKDAHNALIDELVENGQPVSSEIIKALRINLGLMEYSTDGIIWMAVAVPGNGDMLKATYDSNNNGAADNADRLGGEIPEYYAAATHVQALDKGGTGATTPAAARTALGLGQSLYSGSLSVGGNVNISSINNYSLYAIFVQGAGTAIGIRIGALINFSVPFAYLGNQVLDVGAIIISGTNCTFSTFNQITHTAGGNHGSATTSATIESIIGIA